MGSSESRSEGAPIRIMDTTFRDGMQSPEPMEHGKFFYWQAEKIGIFTSLVEYGVRDFEFFSPLVNSHEAIGLPKVIKRRDALQAEYPGDKINILVHTRCNEKEIQSALDIKGIDGLNIYLKTSPQLLQAQNKNQTLAETAKDARTLIENIRKQYPHLILRFSGEDAYRTPLDELFSVYDMIVDSVNRLGMPDTVGIANPDLVKERVRALRSRYPMPDLEGHFQNDRGLALWNAVVATREGMRYMDTTVLGLAERSGLPSMTALILNLYLENPQLVETYNLKLSYSINVMVASILHTQVPWTEPVSLTNRTENAGVHSAAELNFPGAYHEIPLEKFGVTSRQLLLGALSGWHVVRYYLEHILKFTNVTDDAAKQLSAELKTNITRMNSDNLPEAILEKLALQSGLHKQPQPRTHIEHLEE